MKFRDYLPLFITSILLLLLSGCQLANKEPTESPLASLTETYWKLIELDGHKVQMGKTQKREAHFILHNQDKRIPGFNGCNRFFGQFSVTLVDSSRGQLTIGALGATKMACHDLAIREQRVMRVYYDQVSFEISGETLTLFNKDLKALAKFEAIYF